MIVDKRHPRGWSADQEEALTALTLAVRSALKAWMPDDSAADGLAAIIGTVRHALVGEVSAYTGVPIQEHSREEALRFNPIELTLNPTDFDLWKTIYPVVRHNRSIEEAKELKTEIAFTRCYSPVSDLREWNTLVREMRHNAIKFVTPALDAMRDFDDLTTPDKFRVAIELRRLCDQIDCDLMCPDCDSPGSIVARRSRPGAIFRFEHSECSIHGAHEKIPPLRLVPRPSLDQVER